jgi:hypothetical protein
MISGVGQRTLLMPSVHRGARTLFGTRWAMRSLAGPMTRTLLRGVTAARYPQVRLGVDEGRALHSCWCRSTMGRSPSIPTGPRWSTSPSTSATSSRSRAPRSRPCRLGAMMGGNARGQLGRRGPPRRDGDSPTLDATDGGINLVDFAPLRR